MTRRPAVPAHPIARGHVLRAIAELLRMAPFAETPAAADRLSETAIHARRELDRLVAATRGEPDRVTLAMVRREARRVYGVDQYIDEWTSWERRQVVAVRRTTGRVAPPVVRVDAATRTEALRALYAALREMGDYKS